MKAILLKAFGNVDQLYIGDSEHPAYGPEEVLIKVQAAALNRADILQRKGHYPPPKGASDILGLEVSGYVVETGDNAREWQGSKVMTLLSGGGYAEYAAVHKSLLLKVPDHMDTISAAGIMEAFLTAWQALAWLAELQPGEQMLVHAGASGVGTATIQLAKMRGAKVFVTASQSKHAICKELGADVCIDYHRQDFQEAVSALNPAGVNVIIDFIGGSYLRQNLSTLAIDGRMVMLGFLGGTKLKELDLSPFLAKRLKVMGSTLRSRSLSYRGALVADFKKHCLAGFEKGQLKPVIDKIFPWKEVRKAHRFMEENRNQGKVILKVGKDL